MAQDSIINTFNKGMNQDCDFILQPDGTYRSMTNGMLISYDGHHFVIELAKGNKKILNLQPRYSFNSFNFDRVPMAICLSSFIDRMVVLSTNNETGGGGYGEIGLITFTRTNDDFTASYVPYYHHEDLLFSKLNKPVGFTFRENDNLERFYWSDNNTEPKVFNFGDPKFTTYITSTNLVIGKQYMVLSGVITHGGFAYGPTDSSGGISGNIFTATSTTYVIIAPQRVIEYYPLELLHWTPSRSLGSIQFDSYGQGNVNCGGKLYFYRLKSTEGGVYSSWSYPSSPIHVVKENFYPAYLPRTNNYHNIAGAGTTTTIVNSTRSVKIRIDNIDTNFDTIEIACAEFDQLRDVPYKISIIESTTITGSEMIINHIGNANLGDISLNDLTLFPANILRLKTLTTDKNFNIIANTTEREDFDLDLSGVTLNSFEYPIIAHANPYLCTNNLTYDPKSPLIGTNPISAAMTPWSRWIVYDANSGSGNSVVVTTTGTLNVYYTGDVIVVPIDSGLVVTYNGIAKIRPCTTKNRYTANNGQRRENAIELKTAFWDYKDPAVASHNKGYWSNEKYRFGILFFDKKGNPFYVKYISDFIFPDISTKNGLIRGGGANEPDYSLNPSGLNLSNLELTADIVGQISGFSIVRAERDVRIVTQGLVWQTEQRLSGFPIKKTYYPIGSLAMTDAFGNPTGDGILSYLCPDYNLDYQFTKSFMNSDSDADSLEEAGWIAPITYGAVAAVRTDSINGVTISKLFDSQTHEIGVPIRKTGLNRDNGYIGHVVNEGVVAPDFLGNGASFANLTLTGSLGPFVDSATCGTGGITNLTGKQGAGCKKIIINIKTMFSNYATNISYDSNTVSRTSKILMNYVKDIGPLAQYGGGGKDAIAKTLYIGTGHFQPINSSVLADTDVGGGIYRFNNIEVFGGDCFTCIIDNTYTLEDGNGYSYTVYYPCECNANYNLRRGYTPSRQGVSPDPAYTLGISYQHSRLEGYSYNQGYSTQGEFLKYPGLPYGNTFSGKHEHRARYAGEKYSGEFIDSFRTFLRNDKKDLDGRLGEINNVCAKDGKLFAWQNHGVSSLPILERQVVTSTEGDNTSIGTGGVLDRYDPVSSYFGNQHQHGLTLTEYGYFWFDMRNRALCIMGVGGDIQEISLVKGLQVFFNNQFDEGSVPKDYYIYNTDDYNKLEVPLMGCGIIGVYDPKVKMSYLTFKYTKDFQVSDGKLVVAGVKEEAQDFTIGYSHVINAIVGFYNFTPANIHNHNDLVISVNNSKNYVYLGEDMPATTFNIGDIVAVKNNNTVVDEGEYICIKPVVISEYPIADPTKDPLAIGSVYWKKINDQSEIYLQTFNTKYCKFYGKVYDHNVDIIVNPKSDNAVSFLNVQQKSNDLTYTDIYCSTSDQVSKDNNILPKSRNYKYYDKSWFSSLPLSNKGRLTDHYMLIKFNLKNWLTDPTISINKNKIFQFMKTWFVVRK